jgi:hypothetical protein
MRQNAAAPCVFPTTGFISLVTPLDACAGLGVLVGAKAWSEYPFCSASRFAAAPSGAGFRNGTAHERGVVPAESLWPALRHRSSRYVYVKMRRSRRRQPAFASVVEARLARWLPVTHDRSHSDHHATHEFLAYMLGVRRVGVTRRRHRCKAIVDPLPPRQITVLDLGSGGALVRLLLRGERPVRPYSRIGRFAALAGASIGRGLPGG